MPYCRPFVPTPLRQAVYRPAIAILLAAVTLCGDRRATADPFPPEPVAEFRQALIQEKDSVRDKEALRFRRENLTRKARALTSLGEMSRVLLLQEWRVEGIGDPVVDIDREIRDGIADRFINGLKEVIASGDPARSESAAELISETANAARAPGSGFKAGFLRQRLAGLAPDLAHLTAATDTKVQQFGAEALGNAQGDPKLTVLTLEGLIKSASPPVRRAAADALGNVILIVSQQEKRVRDGDAGRGDLRRDLLTTGLYLVPAAEGGFRDGQPVEVRRLSADALQQLSSSLVDLTGDPYPATSYPPSGRPWTADEARSIEHDREETAQEREDLRPLLDMFAKDSAKLSAASGDADPYVRIQIRRVLEDLAIARSRLKRREASIPRGEGVPGPRPDPKPGEKKDAAPKTGGGAFLPSGITPSGVPIVLVAQEKEKAAPDKPNAAAPGAGLQSTLPAVVAGLKDPNIRARLGAVEVLENMGTDAAPAIPALVASLSDSNRFVRWGAIRILGRFAPRTPELIVPALARMLNDDDLEVGVAAANALERYGPTATAAVAALGDRVSRGDTDIRIAVMRTLEAIGTDAAPALSSVALNLAPKSRDQRGKDCDPNCARSPARASVTAAETLGRFGKLASQALPVLQQALSDADADVRRAASEAILKITGN
jgi:HEAT repeat protein